MSSQLSPLGPNKLIPAEREFSTMLQMADQLVKSGLMPDGVKTAAAAFAIIQTGIELGIPPMAAIRGIRVIKGKPEVSPNLAAALIHRDHDDEYGPALIPIVSNQDVATFKYKRRGERTYRDLSYTIDDAKRAKLYVPTQMDATWTKFTRNMLVARALGEIAKLHFQDTINGLFMFGEVEQEVTGRLVDFETGETIEPPPSSFREVPGGSVEADTGEFYPADDAPESSVAPENSATTSIPSDKANATPAAAEPSSAPSTERDDDAVAPHDYRQRLYKNSRGIEHPGIHALAVRHWGLTSVTEMTYRQVDQLLSWINATPPNIFDPVLTQALAAEAQRTADAPIADDEADRINWRERIDAACEELGNGEVWQTLVADAGSDVWRWVMLMALSPTEGKLSRLHQHASSRQMLTDEVKAAHDRRLAALTQK